MTDQLPIALLQMTSVDSWEQNLDWTLKQLQSSAFRDREIKPQCVFLPENCLYLRIIEGEKIVFQNAHWSGFKNLQTWCKDNSVAIHLGSVPFEMDGRFYNSSLFIDQYGDLSPSYQKIHLFDIKLENQKPICESDIFESGQKPAILDLAGWRAGQSICYDLRFAELYSRYAFEEVDLILIPAAFLQSTGKAHWHILNSARAIESQAFVVSASQTGEHRSGAALRCTYGHSLIVGPWGEILLDAGISAGLFYCTLDRQSLRRVRAHIPMKSHRRLISN
jgi:predicted amidohydrolase